MEEIKDRGKLDRLIYFFLSHKLAVFLFIFAIFGVGLYVSPFDFGISLFPRNPIPVDAIPDYGENQQIVFTQWQGRSPQDVEDQVSYPLTSTLQGIPGVKSIRSYSLLGFSTIFIIFKDGIDFYWARSRILEKLSVASRDLPKGVTPTLGPDATAVGQVFWYTLEGRDKNNNPVGGWGLEELRSIQDWYIRYSLQSVSGVSEVASVGGYAKEYHIDIDPDSLRIYKIKLSQILAAVKKSNIDVGAKTLEFNGVEYMIRGIGFIRSVADIENIVITSRDTVPIYIKNLAKVKVGPAMRRGALDKDGTEAVGAAVIVRYGENPLAVIKKIKEKIKKLNEGLPKKRLKNGKISKVTIVPFYDRSILIKETLGTLQSALSDEILLTIVVVVLFLMNFRISMIISLNLPLSVLICFILMKIFKIDSNIMSLSGIAIAIGTIVDMGIIMSENITRHYRETGEKTIKRTFLASSEVGGAVLTAVLTTTVSFLPVFAMDGAEGKLFKPLAYTKTFALIASITCALTIIPAFCHIFMGHWKSTKLWKRLFHLLFLFSGFILGIFFSKQLAFIVLCLYGLIVVVKLFAPKIKEHMDIFMEMVLFVLAITLFFYDAKLSYYLVASIIFSYIAYRHAFKKMSQVVKKYVSVSINIVAAALAVYLMTRSLMPIGRERSILTNFLFTTSLTVLPILFFLAVSKFYKPLLSFMLNFKTLFLCFVFVFILLGISLGLGFRVTFYPVYKTLRFFDVSQHRIEASALWKWGNRVFPGIGKEFMPNLEEGSFLYMPIIMPHGSIGEAMDMLSKQDARIAQIPEVSSVVGKIGRINSALDPAPIGMIETIINYIPEYTVQNGKTVRQWRDHIKSVDDIWKEIVKAADITGATSAPKLQPIATRLIMLQSGMRAPIGIKIKSAGTGDLKKILSQMEAFGVELEKHLKNVKGVFKPAIIADRIVGKPYLEIKIDRNKIARYGITITDVQNIIEIAIGGKPATTTFEGRERYPIRIRYLRELRDSIEALKKILIPMKSGAHIPIIQVADIEYVRGPQVIKSEDGFLVSYVMFDKAKGYSEIQVVENAEKYLKEKIKSGELSLPPATNYEFAGNYIHQKRSEEKLSILLPLCLFIIFLLIYFHFGKLTTTLIIFIAIPVTLSGGFILLWLYGQPWFLDFAVFGVQIRDIFHIRAYNLSVAVWVGFIAVFGIATDDGVVTATYLEQVFKEKEITSLSDIREATIEAGSKRIRACMMTTATTIIALMAVLMSTGRGSDVMIPMAIPSVGGMLFEVITLFVVPVCYCALAEIKWKLHRKK